MMIFWNPEVDGLEATPPQSSLIHFLSLTQIPALTFQKIGQRRRHPSSITVNLMSWLEKAPNTKPIYTLAVGALRLSIFPSITHPEQEFH